MALGFIAINNETLESGVCNVTQSQIIHIPTYPIQYVACNSTVP